MPKLKPGNKVPDFTLRDLEGKGFHLYENLGSMKTMLVFYRGNWCPICNLDILILSAILRFYSRVGHSREWVL